MRLVELRPRLWRWVARHPEATADPRPESPADWPPDVGSVAYAAPDALVLVDPLVPVGSESELDELDALVAAHGERVHILTTIRWHRRSRDELAARYGASTSRARTALPRGVETLPLRGMGETLVWLPEARALVAGDRLLGDGRGGLRLPPESWLDYLPGEVGLNDLRRALRPVHELPVDLVLTSHGEPVQRDGRAAIAAAIGGS
jgi:hypothetical protein